MKIYAYKNNSDKLFFTESKDNNSALVYVGEYVLSSKSADDVPSSTIKYHDKKNDIVVEISFNDDEKSSIVFEKIVKKLAKFE